ncbi:hypothetical protein ACFFX1_23620 [Dactylosporangium sucinum]|uniref:Uncharacterized protein n=1 Tax=Dactylosporangium sucinum TaxID=1424081 RepID=A0A917UA18_9ACTN|nr:hypothetical protein [Dactylosporangium sucinum]GGM71273.1 hypothetical protein GCM10007977_086370 [Dactylosporangium sucinum]
MPARRWHRCPGCGQRGAAAGALRRACRLNTLARQLLTTGRGVRPELLPLLAWWRTADRPQSIRSWLLRRPAGRTLLQALANGSVPITHAGLDDVADTKVVRYVCGVLVASGVLPDRDEHLHRLEQWVCHTVAAVSDPDDRLVVHRYVHWHLLHRLRARTTPQRPVTVERARRLHSHATTAVAVLRAVRAEGSSLATLSEADVSRWLTGRQVAGPVWLGAFLRWAYRQRLCTVTLRAQQWTGPQSRIDHAYRWDLTRRLLHDNTLPLPDRVAGLLVVLYAQTASSTTARSSGSEPAAGVAN